MSSEEKNDSMDTGNEIQVLPEFIANQIAAGEVVQRPESVVKELVENAIDAEASTISVVVRKAGKTLIHVVDNGKGIAKEDLPLAIKRHATSKIHSAEDLHRILTLGFRGEALASIASVAQLEIRSRRRGASTGWRLLSMPNTEPRLEPYQCDEGTQVIVKNLFYNVPARRKFLKSDLAEFRMISDTMRKFALGYPDIRFVFYDDDSLVFDLPPGSLLDRIAALFGAEYAESMIAVDWEDHGIRVTGYIGQPDFAKKSRSEQFLFLNQRPIISRQLQHAVYSAYEHLLEEARYPVFVLFLHLDPEQVDVNVHPQKHEVKFEEERTVYAVVRTAVAEALASADLTPRVGFDPKAPFEKLRIQSPQKPAEELLINRITGEVLRPHPATTSTPSAKRPPQRTTGSARSASQASSVPLSPPPASEAAASPPLQRSASRRYLQLHNKYIVVETAEGFALIDQHAAHERILYEKALRAMNREFQYAQKLLFPLRIELPSSDLALIKELQSALEKLGFQITFVDDHTIELLSVPQDIPGNREKQALLDMLHYYKEHAVLEYPDQREQLAASFACKAAIKSGDALSDEEVEQLIADLYQCSAPYVCPHGRPTVLEFPLKELDLRFGRTPVPTQESQ